MELILDDISKTFARNSVLTGISLKISGGSVYALLGLNGAGKSSLLNIVSGVSKADMGQVMIDVSTGGRSPGDRVDPYSTDDRKIKKIMGVQGQYAQLIEELNAPDYLTLIGLLYKMDKEDLSRQRAWLIRYFYDDEDLTRPISTYSAGMKKKLSLCAALIHKPSVLLLDEPFANLDPLAADRLCELLLGYQRGDRILIVSSHDLSYVDRVATHIGVLSNRRLVFNDRIAVFRQQGSISIDGRLMEMLKPENDKRKILTEII